MPTLTLQSRLFRAFIATAVFYASFATAAPFSGTLISRNEDLLPAYDYVVVGGGVSGLVVANRLTENPDITVLVIEAGVIDNLNQNMLYPRYLINAGTGNSWPITSAPMPELNGRTHDVPCARVLGGGSAINGMMFDRGAQGDYNLWGQLIGDNTWSWAGLLPYFKKSETFTPPDQSQIDELGVTYDMSVHGTSGPIFSSFPPFIYRTAKNFIQAFAQLGIATPVDGAGNALGSFWTPNSVHPDLSERSYARNTYHIQAESRPNYHVLAETLVTKLLPSLNGVEYTAYDPDCTSMPTNAVKHTVLATREIIMAAGSTHTPKVLQLSGIGPTALLNSLSIPQIINLPGVGENFQDHPSWYGTMQLTNVTGKDDSSYIYTNATYDAEMGVLYEQNRTGPWTVSSGSALAFLTRSDISLPSSAILAAKNQPVGAYLRPGLHPSVIRGYEHMKNLTLRSITQNKVAISEHGLGGLTALMKPLSRGYIAITSTDPFALPTVDFRAFTNPFDMAVFIQAIRFNTDILPTTPAMQALGLTAVNPPHGATNAQIEEAIRQLALPSFAHLSGTCAMMKRTEGGCVDRKLRLYGSQGRVRVVDSSMMPVVPGTHLQSTVYAVAERAADIIKETW